MKMLLLYFFLIVLFIDSNLEAKALNIDSLCNKYIKPYTERVEPHDVFSAKTPKCSFNLYCFEDKFLSSKISMVCKEEEFYSHNIVKKGFDSFLNSVSYEDNRLLISAVHVNRVTRSLRGTLVKVNPKTVYDTVLSETDSGIIHIFEENNSEAIYKMNETANCKQADLRIKSLNKCFKKDKKISITNK